MIAPSQVNGKNIHKYSIKNEITFGKTGKRLNKTAVIHGERPAFTIIKSRRD
jgi:hypothetical protein